MMKKQFLSFSLLLIMDILCSPAMYAQESQAEIFRAPNWNTEFVGKPVPEFNLKTIEGEMISTTSLKGKFVILDFWASWCGPCKELTHNLDSALKKYSPEKLQIIGINHGEATVKGGKPIEYWKNAKYTFPMVIDEKYPKKLKAGFPTVVLIDPKGIVVGYFTYLSDNTAGIIEAMIWNMDKHPNVDLQTITAMNEQGEYVRAAMLLDKLNKDPKNETDVLIEQLLKAKLQTNPWMGLNIAKEWAKKSNESKAVMKTIGELIAQSKIVEPDIIQFGKQATQKSL